jgi:hypothetical protein
MSASDRIETRGTGRTNVQKAALAVGSVFHEKAAGAVQDKLKKQ